MRKRVPHLQSDTASVVLPPHRKEKAYRNEGDLLWLRQLYDSGWNLNCPSLGCLPDQ